MTEGPDGRPLLAVATADDFEAWLDDEHETWLQRFTPRRPRGTWSQRNVELVTELIEAGRMRSAGQQEIDAAKADGRWDAAT